MRFRPEDYADYRAAWEDNDPVYPDGTPKHECWNSAALKALHTAMKASLTDAQNGVQ